MEAGGLGSLFLHWVGLATTSPALNLLQTPSRAAGLQGKRAGPPSCPPQAAAQGQLRAHRAGLGPSCHITDARRGAGTGGGTGGGGGGRGEWGGEEKRRQSWGPPCSNLLCPHPPLPPGLRAGRENSGLNALLPGAKGIPGGRGVSPPPYPPLPMSPPSLHHLRAPFDRDKLTVSLEAELWKLFHRS